MKKLPPALQSNEIRYGIGKSPFGWCVIGMNTNKEICAFAFLEKKTVSEALKSLQTTWPKATFIRDDAKLLPYLTKIFKRTNKVSLPLLVNGTDFQIKVWEALLEIPEGATSTYADIARYIGEPKAVRAVGTACGANPIGFMIPCHRILTSDSKLGGYRWGTARKEAILKWESEN